MGMPGKSFLNTSTPLAICGICRGTKGILSRMIPITRSSISTDSNNFSAPCPIRCPTAEIFPISSIILVVRISIISLTALSWSLICFFTSTFFPSSVSYFKTEVSRPMLCAFPLVKNFSPVHVDQRILDRRTACVLSPISASVPLSCGSLLICVLLRLYGRNRDRV